MLAGNDDLADISVEQMLAVVRVLPGYAAVVSVDRGEILAMSAALGEAADHSPELLRQLAGRSIRRALREVADSRGWARLADVPVVRDGNEGYVDLTMRSIASADDPSLVLVDIDDASDRVLFHRAEVAARHAARVASDRYRLLFDMNGLGVVVHGRDGAIEDVNAAALAILGATSLEELRSRDSYDERWRTVREDGTSLPAEEHPAMITLRTGQAVQGALMGFTNISGQHRWLRVTSNPLVDPDGNIDGVCATFEDITEQRQVAELQATLERERHEAALARMQQTIDEVRVLHDAVLPDRLPSVDGLEADARYIAASAAANVGGDWYDLVPLADRCAAVIVGDVVGHGVLAARRMLQLRHWTRLLTTLFESPSEVLLHLNAALHHLKPGDLATVLVARVDLDEGVLCWASAGHPPPVLRTADSVEILYGDRVGPPAGTRARFTGGDHVRPIRAGDTLVAYTDGLVERPGEVLDRGIERLRDAIADAPPDAASLSGHIIDRVLVPERRDDTCVLAVRVAGSAGPTVAEP